MGTLDELLKMLWDDYRAINRQADGIYQLLVQRGETVVNDHIAFRTFNLPELGIDVISQTFVKLGYRPAGEYSFTEKKLKAKHFEPPDERYPKVFISELELEKFSHGLRNIVHKLTMQISPDLSRRWDLCVAGRPWNPVPWENYEKLKTESEYAAWLAVFGFRANHFTVSFNALKTFKDLAEFNAFIKASGYPLNDSGGEIKGSLADYLEQSSTKAHPVEMDFADGKKTVPACYYEFARRYPLPDGRLFQGFVAKSADKIFESTDNR